MQTNESNFQMKFVCENINQIILNANTG